MLLYWRRGTLLPMVLAEDSLVSNDHRSSARLPLEMPVHVRWEGEQGVSSEANGMTRDISGNGLFLKISAEILPQTPLRLRIPLPQGQGSTPMELLAEGRVVRGNFAGEDQGLAAVIDDYRLVPIRSAT